ncbi:MAG: cytochrome c oxidase assembly protein [Alphaproteobacteria bacterium]|nr:cytochrome c oxidase assembly protein [Alphaproteobacteria bacterium]HCP01045.1 cytochrome c oxidase assembly protein [Rhodospirillaceae bacterium]
MNVALDRERFSRRNRYVLAALLLMVILMNGFAYAMVPAYRVFCQKFGFAGIPIVEATVPQVEEILTDRSITVRFNSDVELALDWRFKPVQRKLDLQIGEMGLAFFEALNRHDKAVTGTATFNVTPLKAAPYFVKTECFCFTEQTLSPGQAVQMPVTFFVDPKIGEDRNLDDVTEITLSYTFFRDQDANADHKAAARRMPEQTKVN